MRSGCFIGLACLLTVTQAFAGYKFGVWQSKELPVGVIQNYDNGFVLSMPKTPGTRNYTIAIGNTPDVNVPAQYKLTFRLKGGKTNQNTLVDVHILTDPGNGKRWITHRAPAFSGDSQDWRTYVMGLDTDFHLSDAIWKVVQVKFHLNGAYNPNDHSEIEVRDIRFCSAHELGPQGISYAIHNTALTPYQQTKKPAMPPVKVAFDLDNEDKIAYVSLKDSTKFEEANQHLGFQNFLLKGLAAHTKGDQQNIPSEMGLEWQLFQIVDNNQDADVIVYSRAKPDPEKPHAIKGKKLLVFGSVADEDVKNAIPVQLKYLNQNDYAERYRLKQATQHKLLQGETLSQAAFGQYYSITAKPGATRIIDFENGQPCVVENTDAIYVATGIGAQLLPDAQYYDRFLIRAILYLVNRTDAFSTVDRVKDKLLDSARKTDQAIIDQIRKETPEATTGTWQVGQSSNNFGRFGYNIAEGLLHYSLRRDLASEVGPRSFRVDLPTNSTNNQAKLEIESVNWVGKTMKITQEGGTFTQQVSLLSPFVCYSKLPKSIMLAVENLADMAIFETSQGMKSIKLQGQTVLYDKASHGSLKRPWILIHKVGNTHPLLLVFPRNPERLTIREYEGTIEGFTIELAGNNDTFLAGWPWGTAQTQTDEWTENLPLAIRDKLDLQAKMALNFPVHAQEIFKIDEKSNKVRIIQRTEHHYWENDWNIPKFAYGIMPPLMAIAEREKLIVTRDMVDVASPTEGKLEDLDLASIYGPTLAVLGRSTLTYSLDLPDIDACIVTPDFNMDHRWIEAANKAFQGGVKWSWGGRAPYELLQFDIPGGGRGGDNISPFTWQFGLTTALQGYFLLSDSNRALLRMRVNHRFVEPLDQYQYKNMARHRMEPFSGLQYPVMFRSIYPLGVSYEENQGTKYNYGDCNEASSVIAWVADLLAERFGFQDLVKANWSYLKYNMTHQKVMDDWAYHAGSCREDGAGAWIDMLNGEYAGFISHARAARIAKDKAEQDDAIYRAAKRSVPTLVRLRFHTWMNQPSDPKAPGRTISLVTGFGEYGPKTYPNPLRNNSNVASAMDLFDFSQGAPGALFQLYDKYVKHDVQQYMLNFSIPTLTESGKIACNERYLQPIAFFKTPEMNLELYADQIIESKADFWQRDWPGITVAYPLALTLATTLNAPILTNCVNAKIIDFTFEPATKKLTLELEASESSLATLISPKAMMVNNQQITVTQGTTKLPLKPGKNIIEANY